MRGGREEAGGASRADHTRLFPGLNSVHSATSPWELEVGHSGYVYTCSSAPRIQHDTYTYWHKLKRRLMSQVLEQKEESKTTDSLGDVELSTGPLPVK